MVPNIFQRKIDRLPVLGNLAFLFGIETERSMRNTKYGSRKTGKTTIVMEETTERVGVTAKQTEMRLHFVIDTSGSMAGSRIEAVLRGLKEIYDDLSVMDRLGLRIFSTHVQTLIGCNKRKKYVDFQRLESDIRNNVDGRTALYDAITKAVTEVPFSEPDCERVMIVFTDGADNASSASYSTAKEMMSNPGRKKFRIVLIGAGIDSDTQIQMKGLCKASHCTYLPCSGSKNAIQRVFKETQKIITRTRTIVVQSVHANQSDLHHLEPALFQQMLTKPVSSYKNRNGPARIQPKAYTQHRPKNSSKSKQSNNGLNHLKNNVLNKCARLLAAEQGHQMLLSQLGAKATEWPEMQQLKAGGCKLRQLIKEDPKKRMICTSGGSATVTLR
eukprot:TRINITY_DN1999_c0_g1_i1.p1 TRINITY_DN1999_c0_g1~~TRINITY_DN1999_c0_g1_i1.p1  ORF type:complete len:386 (-),score=58.68 TRINITY_DN1999_c0_g1_i1:56-1213(-)